MPFVILIACGIIAFLAARHASATGRDPVVWGLVGFFTGGIGLIILGLVDKRPNEISASRSLGVHRAPSDVSVRLPSAAPEPAGYDLRRWQALIEVDDEIAAATEQVKAYGDQFEHELAQKYLALNDKSYLAPLVKKITDRADAALREVQKQQSAMDATLDERARQVYQFYAETVRDNGGLDPTTGQRVEAITQYQGDAAAFAGGIKIVLASGRTVLRASGVARSFNTEAEADAWGRPL